ncbi:hypothetical protein EH31_02000 [Erythrobacter longus]|uniref:Uncharacterized protein n=1 Tax=Erythrobacter longus TaxID=1044 RepID=A0A074N0M0_ERYLO|nr:hypothetical protein [Erythrobacter longus]KEO91462.1 hypothetical protein EH31_02000 [Erythrobacter longus]
MKTKIASAALAITALASGQALAAQQACVEPADLGDTITYAMPMLYEAVEAPCSAIFAKSDFMTNEADAFLDQFRERQDDAWPGTLRLLKVFMAQQGEKNGGEDAMASAIAMMPEDSLRPIVDVIIGQMVTERIAKEIKVSTCSDVAEAMELIAPLPPENISGLTVFLAKQAKLDDPKICGVATSPGSPPPVYYAPVPPAGQ